MGVLSALQPARVFRHFENICAIPHGSGNVGAVGDYCARFAASHGLRSLRDESGNVVLFKDGDPSRDPVILQGHLDMVCVCEPGTDIDFARDGLPIATDGEYVFSRGTTLGADDGIAVAMILALLEEDDPVFPPIEAVFTADEETGMFGALGLDVSCLSGTRMLNLDSEAEGTFWVSCAGGERVTFTLPLQRQARADACIELELNGLLGGHSGTEIDKGRQNAVRCMTRILLQSGARLVSMHGGKVDNAIPSACTAVVCAEETAVRAVFDVLAAEWRQTEPDVQLAIRPAGEANALTGVCTEKVLRLIEALPCGVQAYSRAIKGFVETSLNLGVTVVEGETAELHYSVRSSVDADRAALVRRLTEIASRYGAKAVSGSAYPAWPFREHSPLRDAASRAFTAQYGCAPRIEGVHAGLECGIFCGKIPSLDCISMGPDITDIHSPQEKLSVPSAARTYALVREILRTI